MYTYLQILRRLEKTVKASYARQVLDRQRPEYGAFISQRDGCANPDHTGHAKDLAAACYLFLTAGSALAGDAELCERIRLAIAFQQRWQRPTGLIDLISVNWESPPDTAFTVQLLSPVVAVARARAEADPRAGEIADSLGEYVRTAAQGIIGRGFHTPNHRWVVCSALAQAMSLFPDLPASPYLERILAETIDINDDGEFTERSTGVYNAVCDRSLRFMADHLNRPELLDPVRKNLDMMAYLFHHDGAVVTSISKRQDRGARVIPSGIADSFFAMAQRDRNGVWASIADMLVANGRDPAHDVWLIQPFMENPAYQDDTLQRQPLPDQYRRFFPVSRLWRVKRGLLSATASADNLTAFALRYGDVNLTAVKLACTYSATGTFEADQFAAIEHGVRMVHLGVTATRPVPGYDLPLGRPVPLGTFGEVRAERERWTLPPMDQILEIREVDRGFDLQLKTEGGLDRVTYQVEFCFEGPGEWETADQVVQVQNNQTAILKAGYGIFHRGEHAIRIGPGQAAHRM